MINDSNLSANQKLMAAAQHLLTMVPASMAVPLILGNSLGLDPDTIALLVSANFFVNGMAILTQAIGIGKYIGGKLPIFFGASFVPLAPALVIGKEHDISTIFGAVIGSAVIMYLLSFRIDRILKFFPKVVVGSFVMLVGLSLAPIAMRDLAGGVGAENYGSVQNIAIGFTVFAVVILISKLGREGLKSLSLILGIGSGTAIAWALGILDVQTVRAADWFQMIDPLFFGFPKFKLGPIFIMTIFSIVNMIQCFGAFSVLDEVLKTETDDNVKIRAMRSQILSQGVGGIFGSVPTTIFNENIGLMDIIKISSKSVTILTGALLMVVGMVPKVSSFMTMIPKPVLGGVTLALFGVIISAGISILSNVDFTDGNNFTIAGTSIAIGVGSNFTEGVFNQFPDTAAMLLGNGLFMASVSAILLNIILNRKSTK